MPNHITNVVKASEKVIASMLNADKSPDFSCVIMQPECLDDFNPHSGIITRARAAMGQLGKSKGGGTLAELSSRLEKSNAIKSIETPIPPEDVEQVAKAIECYQQCGHFYWYDWNIERWGTKWNAYSYDETRSHSQQLVFETAWSMPVEVAIALSKKFPEEEIIWQFADEDTGSNCGTMKLKNGETIEEDVSPGWNELDSEGKSKWIKFAFELRHPNEDPKEHGYDENFNYIEQ